MVIWKYNLFLTGQLSIQMPKGAKVLSVGVDPQGYDSIWAFIPDENAEKEERVFYCIGTGWDIEQVVPSDTEIEFIGTICGSPYVWHIFEEIDPSRA